MEEKAPLFPTFTTYTPQGDDIKDRLPLLQKRIKDTTGTMVVDFKPLGKGMNANFTLFCQGQTRPSYQLKIISRKGYPPMEKLLACHGLLQGRDIACGRLICHDEGGEVFPYGYIIQAWVEGQDGTDRKGWLAEFVLHLKRLHRIKLPYYGSLGTGPRYETLQAYYQNLDMVIDSSFGKTLQRPASIWDLDEVGLISPGFLPSILETVAALAKRVSSPKPHLLHGDMSAANIIFSNKGTCLIDWDEARSHWWPAELARTLFFWDSKGLFYNFIRQYDDQKTPLPEVDIVVKLEHLRQLLRYVFMVGFRQESFSQLRARVGELEKRIEQRLHYSYLE